VTSPSMHDARDAEDQRLLDAGEFNALVESYYGVMLDRCRLKLHTEAEQTAVAAEVAIRLLSELKRGRRYRVPFRVVVHQVIGWKINEHFAGTKLSEVELQEEWMHEASTDGTAPLEELVAEQGFEALLVGLTELEREVVTLRYNDDLDFGEIAERLGKEPNAVHQIHHRALAKLRRSAA
jgi:RNA polymerase sigma factor (sigma-70 family)